MSVSIFSLLNLYLPRINAKVITEDQPQGGLDEVEATLHELVEKADNAQLQLDYPKRNFRRLSRVRPLTITHPTKDELALEQKIRVGRGDPVAYKVAYRQLQQGRAPDEIAFRVSLPLHEIRKLEDIMREELRTSRDEAMLDHQVKTLLDELVIEKIPPAKPAVFGYWVSSNIQDSSEPPEKLEIERRQVVL